jgi:hypothetical protein
MAKKKHKKHGKPFRNASAPRAPRGAGKPEDETALKRLAYTAGGAAGTALAGSFLRHEGWAPKTVAAALGAVGAGLAWKGDEPTIRSVGAGVMSAAGAQLVLMTIEERDAKEREAKAKATVAASAPPIKRQADTASLPPGALEAALARAQARLALSEGELAA